MVLTLLTQLRERFSGEDYKYTQALLSFIPLVLLGLNDDQVLSAEHFIFLNQDLLIPKSLAGELERWKRLWSNVDHSETIPDNFVQAHAACDADSYRNSHCLLLIGCTLPLASAEAERTFSLLCRIKTYTQSSLTEEDFSDMAVIAMHFQERIPVEDILKAFIQQHPKCIFQKSVLED